MKLKSCHHRSGWKSKLEDEELMVRILKVKELQMMTRSRCSPRGSWLTWRLGWWRSHCSVTPRRVKRAGGCSASACSQLRTRGHLSEGHLSVSKLLWTLIFWSLGISLGINSFTWQMVIECSLGVKHCLCVAWRIPFWTTRGLRSGEFAPLESWFPCGCYVTKGHRMMYVGKESKKEWVYVSI